jgi:DNA-nicking Smr family endonuclease
MTRSKKPPVLTEEPAILFGLEAPRQPTFASNIKRASRDEKASFLLSDDSLTDQEIWARVIRNITPLRKFSISPPQLADLMPSFKKIKPSLPKIEHKTINLEQPASQSTKVKPPYISSFDRKTWQDIMKGKLLIENRIDLHGLHQAVAYDQLKSFIHTAHTRNNKLVMIITGKGKNGSAEKRGILRRLVPLWLTSADFQHWISGFQEAHPHHGGAGALYVRLRYKRGK